MARTVVVVTDDHTRPNGIIVLIGILAMLFFGVWALTHAPGTQPGSPAPTEVTCTTPYIKVQTQCCLDQNNNGICDTDDQRLEEEKKLAELQVKKDAATAKIQGKLSTLTLGMDRKEVEQVLGFEAEECIEKTFGSGGIDCTYRTKVDDFNVSFIAVFNYLRPGYRYYAQYQID